MQYVIMFVFVMLGGYTGWNLNDRPERAIVTAVLLSALMISGSLMILVKAIAGA